MPLPYRHATDMSSLSHPRESTVCSSISTPACITREATTRWYWLFLVLALPPTSCSNGSRVHHEDVVADGTDNDSGDVDVGREDTRDDGSRGCAEQCGANCCAGWQFCYAGKCRVRGDGAGVFAMRLDTKCLLRENGKVVCWGWKGAGHFGDGDTSDVLSTPIITPFPTAVHVACSSLAHDTCVVAQDGSVWCAGENAFGQLGNGECGEGSAVPVKVIGLEPEAAVAVALEERTACADRKSVV